MSEELATLEQLQQRSSLVERNRKSNWPDLQPKHKMLAYYYLEEYNWSKAAKKVGISGSTASAMFRNDPVFAAFVNDLQEEYAQRSVVNADFVRVQWLKVLPMVMGEEEVPLVYKGDQFSAKQFDSNATAKVLTELGKSTKFYEGGTGQGGVQVNINLEALGIKEEKVIDGQFESPE